ncbi:adhesion G-protein coupled receptor D2 isoform X8 [Gallus gallus]|uniref:adhesion G-protein coupled receptor D2 isoform X8 n=1 Tax=Gallus gallus TaxID=9031 RepID=UPI001AE69C68|nr:adhesion G-protein coupled receptor D2 isoform X8 [Gallus gallus]XP_040541487.1 adhesion G-protein coupled receptor D2 isoform X8 [Gallus gallus]
MRGLRPDSWFFSFLVGSLSRSLFASAALAENQTSKDFAPVMIETLRHMYEYVPTALDWWHADRFCDQRFAQLLFEPPDSEQSSFSKLLQSHHIKGSVWLNERDGVLHKPKWRRNHIVPVLVFGDKTDTKYVKVLSDFPVLPAVTACAHLQWDTRTQEIATVFSYAVPAFINEFQLRGFVDEEGFVRFALIVHGHHSPYLPVFRADGQWHHFCVTWQQENGTWAIYADGKRRASASGLCTVGLAAPQAIYGQGTFIIGQDQDSLGGTFKAKESFSGNITDLHIWQKVLSMEQIENVRSCWMVEQELVFGWSLNALEIESTVEEVTAQFLCPGPVEECRVFEVGSSGFRHTSCLQSLPFICCYRKDAYWQLKKAQLESSHFLVSHVNMLAKRMVQIPENIFTSNVQDMNLSVALSTLDVLATVLRKEETPVESSDLLMVLQLLKQVADVEVQEREELEMLEQLGQYYVEVTELILEEQNIETWSSISQAVRGPMAVVELCNRVVSLLAPLLTSGRTKITIQHQNVGMEVRKLELSSQQLSSETYLIQSPEEDRPDFIEIPVEEMQRLKAKGLRRVTVKNMWFGYSSLQRCLPGPGSSAAFQDVAASDGGQKYLSTAVRTAVISSTVLSDYQEISTSVRYRLQHHTQDLPDKLVGPICAFWNFSLSPDAGGMWSTAGCSVVTSLPDSTVCFCNHTTNFAVLLQVYEIERTTKDELTLQTLTFIGCGVSFCALVVTFILFLVVGVPKSERTTVHKNLIFALAAAEALLMFSELAKTNQVNTFVLFRVVMVTVSSARRRAKMLTLNSSLENQIGIQIWATAKPILVLLPVLGLTWVCGILVHLSIIWAYIFIMLNSLQGLYIFLVYAIYNSEVRNAIQRMKDKKKALSFTNCSHPINYLSSPRNTTSWETGKPSPAAESASSNHAQKDPPVKNITNRGNFGGKIPMGISSIMSPERPAVELTAFKSSVSKQGKLRLFSRRCHPEALQLSSPQWTHERGRQRCLGVNVLQSQAQHCAH